VSIASILSIARTAITAQQTATQVISQNISNATTEGYSRQRAELAASTPQMTPRGTIGTGVSVFGVTRARDVLLDQSFRQQASGSAGASVRSDTLGAIEQIFNEPSENGLAASLDAFWSSWSDLANDPTNPTAQGVVRQRGASVATLLHSYSGQLDTVRDQVVGRLTDAAQSLNRLSSQVASLNRDIVAAESSGGQSPDLRDARDRLLDQMAAIAPIQVITGSTGRVAVTLAGGTIVDGASSRDITITGTALAPSVTIAGDSGPLRGLQGGLGAMLDLVNTDIAGLHADLDAFARGLVNAVNVVHRSGYTPNGEALGNGNWNPALGLTGSNIDFFDSTSTTAANIQLSAAVKGDSSVIAAGATFGVAGDNSVALAIGSLRDRTGAAALRARMGTATYDAWVGLPGSTTFGESYRGTVSTLGLDVRAASDNSDVLDVLRDQAETRRSSASGVSIDEELTKLMSHQQAYAAAAKLVRAADEMAQAILGMVN
jgi:flagellar hook-associated protein 1 FlgK